MTYFELYEQALHKLNYEGITIAEFEQMIKPLKQEIPEKKRKSPEELYQEIASNADKKYTKKIIKFDHTWIPVEKELPDKSGYYVVTISHFESYVGDIIHPYKAYWNTEESRWNVYGGFNYPKVLAWLPIEPYNVK